MHKDPLDVNRNPFLGMYRDSKMLAYHFHPVMQLCRSSYAVHEVISCQIRLEPYCSDLRRGTLDASTCKTLTTSLLA